MNNEQITITKERLVEAFENSPRYIKDFLTSKELDTAILKLISLRKLRLDAASEIENDITLVLLGLKTTGDFVKKIRADSFLSDEEKESLIKYVNQNIFEKIRGDIKERLLRPEPRREAEISLGESYRKTPEERAVGQDETEEKLDRARILKEIEEAEEFGVGKNTDKGFLSENVARTESSSSASAPSNKSITEKKLETSSVSVKEEIKQKPDGGIDPYREPIKD